MGFVWGVFPLKRDYIQEILSWIW